MEKRTVSVAGASLTTDGLGAGIAGGGGIAGEGVAGEGLTGEGVTGEGVTGEGVTGEGVTGEGVTGEGVTGEGVTGEGVTGEGVTGEGVGDAAAEATARGDESGRVSRSIRAWTSGQPSSCRVRLKSALTAASEATPISARRWSMTSASCGRPLNDWARASRYISDGSFGGPVWTARQARS